MSNDNTSQLRESLQRTREEALRADLDYNRRLFGVSNSYMSASHKIVMWAVRRYILILWHFDNAVGQFVEVCMSELAVITGLSPRQVGRALMDLDEIGMVERREKKDRLKSGAVHTHIYIALTLLSFYPENLRLEKKRNHGGERQRCKFCQSENLVRRTVVICEDCHRQQDAPVETPINPVDGVLDVPPGRSPMPDGEVREDTMWTPF